MRTLLFTAFIFGTFSFCKKENHLEFYAHTPKENIEKKATLVLHLLSNDPLPNDTYGFECPISGWQYRNHSIDEIMWFEVEAEKKSSIALVHVRNGESTFHQYSFFANENDTIYGLAIW
jgi:hypothetical protein